MRKLVAFFFLMTAVLAFGQNRDFPEITFYGVDFSQVKVFGAKEHPRLFKEAFDRINGLFLTEPKKYDIGKFLDTNVKEVSLDAVDARNNELDLNELTITVDQYALTDEQIEGAIRNLPIEGHEGVGVVILAELLNKPANRGYYQVVYFDIKTKTVLDVLNGDGKAGGFGLRNFWAGSIHKMLKDL